MKLRINVPSILLCRPDFRLCVAALQKPVGLTLRGNKDETTSNSEGFPQPAGLTAELGCGQRRLWIVLD